MTTYTARYGFPQINEGSDNVDVVNDFNVPWATLDTVLGTQVCTSTTRPSAPVVGQLIYETDTGFVRKYLSSDAWQTVGNAVAASGSRPSSSLLVGDELFETDTAVSRTWTGSAWSSNLSRSTSSSLPANPLQGDLTYTTNLGGLAYYSGSAWHFASLMVVTSGTRPSGSALQTGTHIFETDTGRSMIYTGSQWVPTGSILMAAPVTTTSAGTPSSGTTETFDTVLGYYSCSLISGRRYRVTMDGLTGNCGVAGDIYGIYIRDSQSASDPTSSSTLVASAQWTSASAGTSSRLPIQIGNTFLCTVTGTHTFGMSSIRFSGTGAFTPEPASPSGTAFKRELYVVDMGTAY